SSFFCNSKNRVGLGAFPKSGVLVSRVVRGWWIVIAAVQILVALRQGYLGQAQEAQRRGIFRNRNVPIQVLELLWQRRFVPVMKYAASRRDIRSHNFLPL